jgi:hypothetical protein
LNFVLCIIYFEFIRLLMTPRPRFTATIDWD